MAAVWLSACGPITTEESTSIDALTTRSPVPGYVITTPFGKEGDLWAAGYHTGDDYAAPKGTRVQATRAGRVVGAAWNVWGSAYGQQVIIDTNGIRHLYAHLSRISVKAGQHVEAGQKVGEVGETGHAYGYHLHYEERHSPYGYYDHRKPVFNHSGAGGGRGYKNWIFETSHRDVRFLQRALVSAGCDVENKYTDYYGDQTKRAVACFQRKQGWSGSDADGIVGPETAKRLHLVGSVDVSKLHAGVTGAESVRILQQRMNEVRAAGLHITGNYNAATREAVAAWQRSIGDSGAGADGNMGPLQSERLFPDHRYQLR